MKIYIEIELDGPEEELGGAAQLIVDKSNALGKIPIPGTNITMSNYNVYTPPKKAKATRKVSKAKKTV